MIKDTPVRFECQGSGKCCVSRGDYGYVYLTKNDQKNMAKALGLSQKQFLQKHCTIEDDICRLKSLPGQGECRFLNKSHRCTVYEGRPVQCRTWPFWPENMNAKTWTQEVAKFCPGVGKGRPRKASDIRRQVREQLKSELEIFDPELYDVADPDLVEESLRQLK